MCLGERHRVVGLDALIRLLDVSASLPVGMTGSGGSRTVAARIHALAEPPPKPRLGGHMALHLSSPLAAGAGAPALYAWAGQLRAVVASAGRWSV